MGKIDTSGWKEFRIGDLFEACLSKDDIQPKDFVEGEIPLVSSGKENNGIIAFVEDKKARLWEANTLTIDMFGKVFYQENPYFAVSHGRVNILLPKISMTKECLQFMGCAIEKVTLQKYAFNEMCTGTKVLKDNIKLPATPDGAPDWAYMESYMANIETKVAESLTLLQAAKDAEKKKVDTREWGGFRVGELFEKLNLRFLPNRVFDKASDISEVKSEEFNLPLVNAKHSNNGIMYYGRKHEWEYEVLTIDIVADGAASTGDVYAQPQETGVLYNAYLVKPKAKCVTGLILFFLSTVIQRCVKDHFGYDNKCTWDKVKHETILLPIDKTGQPDWGYMEEYIRKVEERVKATMGKYEMTVNEVAL